MRITLIHPRDSSYNPQSGLFSRPIMYAPLTLTTLAALIPPELHADVRVIDEGCQDATQQMDADIVGISVLTATARRAYELAAIAKGNGSYVVLGGYHVTLNPDEASRHADTIFVGQADMTWPAFLEEHSRKKARGRYDQQGPVDMRGQPSARREMLARHRYFTANTIQASRSCSNQCSFCAISYSFHGHNVRRPVDEVVDEAKRLPGRSLLFLDPNLHEDRDYSLELMRGLVPLRKQWACLTTIGTARDAEQVDLMRESGCIGVLTGIESICQDTVERANKRFNHVSEYEECIRAYHEHGIGVLGCFVFGFDTDDTGVFRDTVDFVNESGIDLPRFSVLTPFPGTPLFRSLERQGRIIDGDYDHYDFQHVVFRPKTIDAHQLQDGLLWSWREAFRARHIIRRTVAAPTHPLLCLATNLGFRRYGRLLSR